MATNVVNLDALIPREDFAVEDQQGGTSLIERISILHLESFIFAQTCGNPTFSVKRSNGHHKKLPTSLERS